MRFHIRTLAKLKQGVSDAGRPIGYYLTLLVFAVIVLSLGWWWLSSTIGGLIPHFGWPSWAHLPHWFSSDTVAATSLPAPIETATATTEPEGACNGWGYKSCCWKK